MPLRVHQEVDADGRALLDRWVDQGLIQREQADRICREEGWERQPATSTAAAHAGGRGSLIVEALGYLGGILIVVAAVLIANRYWASLPTWGRVALLVAAAALLLGAGRLAYRHRSARTARLRAVLWLASTAAIAVALWVAGRDVLGLPEDENLALLAGVGIAAYAGLLDVLTPTFLQQMALFLALGTAGAAAGNLPKGERAPSGLAILGLAAMWLTLGWGNMLHPRRGSLALGAVGTLVGAMITVSAGDWGLRLCHYDGCRIRAFIPLLVERASRDRSLPLPLRLVNADTHVQVRAGVAATAPSQLPIRPAEVQVGWG